MEIVLNRQKVLGRGGQGDVFEGTLRTIRKPVAVKRVSLLDVDSTCKQEEEALGKLNHFNVVKLLHAESDEDFRYYALELCQASLDKVFLKDGNEKKYHGPKPSVGDMLLQLANGLEYIHGQKLVHRDVKPENVLIWVSSIENSSDEGTKEVLMKWADFGLSKRVNDRGTFTMSGIKGTSKWFAPELFESSGIDRTSKRRGTIMSDVFAEGLTFAYILLEGKHPYEDENKTSHKTESNLKKNKPMNLKSIEDKPEHGKQLYEMLCTMLRPTPSDRLTAKQVLDQLQKIYMKSSVATDRSTHPQAHESPFNNQQGQSGSQIGARQEQPQGQSFHSKPSTPKPRSSFLTDQFVSPRTETTTNVRFAESIKEQCARIGKRNGMDLYSVPLRKTGEIGNIAERYSFGGANGNRMLRKTILVMGATGSGKTSLINGMINYIFDVQWDDAFRFQLIQEQEVGQSQSHSQTSKITAYDIYHCDGFRVPYSLTIVDTPGYGDTKGIDRDQEITEMVRQFFEDKGGIQELDMVGFVTPAPFPRLTPTQHYIFDSVLSIFGNDVKENINFLLTFADTQDPPVLKAIAESKLPYAVDAKTGDPLHQKFNNAGFFCSNRWGYKFNKFFWDMGMENFDKFFNMLIKMKPKSLSLTIQVLNERKHLEATVDGLQPRIKFGMSKMEEMKKCKQMGIKIQAQIEFFKKNNQVDDEVTVAKKVEVPAGTFLTNCNKCLVTCHYPCSQENDDGKVNCSAMDKDMPEEVRTCTVCPEKCLWTLHSNQQYRWEYVKEKDSVSPAIRRNNVTHESQMNTKVTLDGLIEALESSILHNEQALLERTQTVKKCMARLETIALRPNPFLTHQYIDLIIDAEKHEMRSGFEERIESLNRLRSMSEIQNRIRNNIPLY